jgi:hypothetical protein
MRVAIKDLFQWTLMQVYLRMNIIYKFTYFMYEYTTLMIMDQIKFRLMSNRVQYSLNGYFISLSFLIEL